MTDNLTRRKHSLSVLARRQQLILDEARMEHARVIRELEEAESNLQKEERKHSRAQSELESLLVNQVGIDLNKMNRLNAFVQHAYEELQTCSAHAEKMSHRAAISSQQLGDTALSAKLFGDALSQSEMQLNALKAQKEQTLDLELWLSGQWSEPAS